MNNILVIDDEREICDSISMILEYENYFVDTASETTAALKKLEYFDASAIILDIQMPGMTGFEILKWLQEKEIHTPVIVISAYSSLENAVKATKLGAFDFIEKPIDRDKLLISVRNAVERAKLKKENEKLKKELEPAGEIIGESAAVKNILATIERVAKTDARVMITGENGTGKELVARAIHKLSSRNENEMVEVNCAAIPTELIESELFGHEKGSFTGALAQRIGKFEKSNKSTLFLDEIGDMSMQAQAKVLRAIEDSSIERVGGNQKINVDVRILSATNKNLEEEIKEGNFREDLFHRLNVIPIFVPPLRDRVEDIPLLANHFVKDLCKKNGFPEKEFDRSAMELLMRQKWSGNVRELRNFIERVIIMVVDDVVKDSSITSLISGNGGHKEDDFLSISNSFQEFKEKAERTFILKQLEANDWNISKTSDILDIQRSHLYGKMKKYNIEKGK